MFNWVPMLWKGLKWLGGAIVSPITAMRKSDTLGRVLRWIAHGVFLLLALVGLTALNYYLQLDKALSTPLPVLRLVWLPLLCLLAYSLLWLGWWICRVLATPREPSPFPDIDAAWNSAVRTLEQRGVDLTKTPLFLTLGRPAEKEINLFNAARLPLLTAPVPQDSEAPLHVYATAEAVYVACGELSLLGRQAVRFTQARRDAEQRAQKALAQDQLARRQAGAGESSDVEVERIPIDAAEPTRRGTAAPVSTTAANGPATRTAADSDQGLSLVEQHVALLMAEDEQLEETFVEHEQAVLDPLTVDLSEALLKEIDEVEVVTARLQHLCRRIAEVRRPYCPLNGALLLIPAAAVDCDRTANHVAVLAQKDLDTVRDSMKVDCPHVAIVCDVEQTPGCGELLDRFPEDQRQRRLGVRFPRLAEGDVGNAARMIEQGVAWMCDELIPPLVYRLFPLAGSSLPQESGTEANSALYRFLYRMRSRRERLTRVLQRAVCSDSHRPTMFGGCYLVATGTDAQREQGFAASVFGQLVDLKDFGAWTDRALEEDKRRTRWARIGYAGLAAVAIVLLAAIARM